MKRPGESNLEFANRSRREWVDKTYPLVPCRKCSGTGRMAVPVVEPYVFTLLESKEPETIDFKIEYIKCDSCLGYRKRRYFE